MDIDCSPEALHERYDPRVRYVASWTRYRGLDHEALVQAGHQGVLEARWRYLESPEPPPSTPFDRAVWSYIRNAITRAAAKQRPRLRRVDDVRHAASLEQLDGYFRTPTEHDLIGGMVDVLGQVASSALAEVYADPDAFAAEAPTPEERAHHRRMLERLAAAIGFLERDERAVVEARHLDDRSFVDIAAALGRSERWVRELHRRALRRLRANLADQRSAQRMVR